MFTPKVRLASTCLASTKVDLWSLRPVSTSPARFDADPRPFTDIPSVPMESFPILGSIAYMAKLQMEMKVPRGAEWHVFAELRDRFVPEGGPPLMRFRAPPMNPNNDGRVLQLFEPEDVEAMYRNEGKYPDRGAGFQSLRFIRKRIPEVFGTATTGLITEDGETWQTFRSKVQQDLMRPKSAMFYVKDISNVADDFLAYTERLLSPSDRINTSKDYLIDLHRFNIEATGMIAVDSRMGCLDEKPNQEALDLVTDTKTVLQEMWIVMNSPPFYEKLPNPRWQPSFRRLEDAYQRLMPPTIRRIKEATAKIVEKGNLKKEEEVSVLEKLIMKHGPDSPEPKLMAMDMFLGGVDTAGNTLGFLFYNLATNPDKQELLRREIAEIVGMDGEITEQKLNQMSYLRACIQESLRILPTVGGNLRIIPDDMTLRGYNIPAGTLLLTSSMLMSRKKEIFPDPEVYRPERWLRGEERKSIHPFTMLQFSHGTRKCIGKRFAELNMHTLTIKMLQKYRLEWAKPGVKVEPRMHFLMYPQTELKFKFEKI